jgi:hypothetical protein
MGSGGNVGGDCPKVTLKQIKGWVEDLVKDIRRGSSSGGARGSGGREKGRLTQE